MLGLSEGLLDKARHGDMSRGREVHQFDLGYRGALLALAMSERPDGIQPGDRMPDAVLRSAAGQPRCLYDLLAGPHWKTLVAGDTARPACAGVNVVMIGDDGQLRDDSGKLGPTKGEQCLIHPDGYVGARFVSGETHEMTSYLSQVLLPYRS